MRKKEYYEMYNMYLMYEEKYWKWAELRKTFNKANKERKYFRRNNARNRRKMAEQVINDFPELVFSGWDLKCQIGGCKEIVLGYGLTKWDRDTSVMRGILYGSTVYMQLKEKPDLIYRAIEETYDWSIELGIRTTILAETIPKVIKFIAEECVC